MAIRRVGKEEADEYAYRPHGRLFGSVALKIINSK